MSMEITMEVIMEVPMEVPMKSSVLVKKKQS
jgi:hypothetical protein